MDPRQNPYIRASVRRINRALATPVDRRTQLARTTQRLRDPDGSSALRRMVAGKIVLITGASSGIGRATAEKFGAAGATVLLVARGEEALHEVAAGIIDAGGAAHVHPCDLTDLAAIDALVERVLAEHGHVDVLVNNAGISIRRKAKHSLERFHDFERPMQLNYFAAIRLTLGLLPAMVERQSGQVVNISSWAVGVRPARFAAYTASKAALEAWSDCLQGEVFDDGIVFSNVRMPLVRTPMITPTKIYSQLPALSPAQAADVVAEAVVRRSRRLSPWASSFMTLAEAASPRAADRIRKNAV